MTIRLTTPFTNASNHNLIITPNLTSSLTLNMYRKFAISRTLSAHIAITHNMNITQQVTITNTMYITINSSCDHCY